MESVNTPGLSTYLAAVHRRRRLMTIVALPVVIAAATIALSLPSIFTAPAEFQFEESAIATLDAGRHNHDEYLDQYVTKLAESVLTRENLTALRGNLRLYPDLSNDDSTATDKIEKGIHVDMVTERILDPESGRPKDVNAGFKIYYDARSASEAQQASNWLVNQFIGVSRQSRRGKSMHTADFLATEAESYRIRIAQLESKFADFKSKHVNELPESTQANVAGKERIEQDLNNAEQDIRTLQQNRIFLETQLQQVQANGGDNETLHALEEEYNKKAATYDKNHPDMIALRQQIETARRTGGTRGGTSLRAQLDSQKAILAQVRQRYSEDHPDVKRIERTISDLEARLASGESPEVDRTPKDPATLQLQTQLRGTDNQIASLQVRAGELRGKLNAFEVHLGSSPQVEKEYQNLTRDLGLARDKYDQILKQKMDAEFNAAATMAGSGDEFRLTQQPGLPSAPSKPSRVGILILGCIFAVFLAVVAGVGAEALDQTARGSRDVYSILDVTPMAIVPEIHNSAFLRRRSRELRALALSALVGFPILFFLVRIIVR